MDFLKIMIVMIIILAVVAIIKTIINTIYDIRKYIIVREEYKKIKEERK